MNLFETKNLVVKELPLLNEKKKKEMQASNIDKQARNFMTNQINDYQRNNDFRSKEMIKNLYKIMDKHYVKMKEDVAICAELYNDDHEAANDKAYE